MHLVTCIGFCSLNLTSYRQRRKFLRRDVSRAYHFLPQFSLGMCASYIAAVLMLYAILLCYVVFSESYLYTVLSWNVRQLYRGSLHAICYFVMLCCVQWILPFYRQWRKFLRRDVYRAYHFLRQFSLGMFASYIEAVWGIHWLPNHTWLVDGFFSAVFGKTSLTCRRFFFSFSAGILVASPSFLSYSPVPVLCCWLFGGGYSPHLECSTVTPILNVKCSHKSYTLFGRC